MKIYLKHFLVSWLHIVWVIIVKFLRHYWARENFISGLTTHCITSLLLLLLLLSCICLYNLLLLLCLRYFTIHFIFIDLSFFHNFHHSFAQISILKVSACLWTLVLLAAIIISINTFIILKVNVINIISYWYLVSVLILSIRMIVNVVGSSISVIRHFCDCSSIIILILMWFCRHFVKFELTV